MSDIPDRISTKVADRALAAVDSIFTPIIQLEMEFDYSLDEKRLAKAVALTMDAEPILGCRFVRRVIRPYWERVEIEKTGVFVFAESESEYIAFRNKGIEFAFEPQISVCLYRSELKDRVTIKVSHLVSDAAGVKDIASVMSRIYRRLAHEPDYRPTPAPCSSRGFWQIARHVPWYVHPVIVLNYLHEVASSLIPYKTHGVPINSVSPAGPMFFWAPA